eukprot:5974346-Prymnesium_polylepis.1
MATARASAYSSRKSCGASVRATAIVGAAYRSNGDRDVQARTAAAWSAGRKMPFSVVATAPTDLQPTVSTVG